MIVLNAKHSYILIEIFMNDSLQTNINWKKNPETRIDEIFRKLQTAEPDPQYSHPN